MTEKQFTCILVDDEPNASDALELLLRDTGMAEVLEKISDSTCAEATILSLRPDLVFLDIDMPQLNGFELLEKLHPKMPSLNVVFVTAFNQYVLAALRHGAFDYLQKPVDRLELKNMLNRLADAKSQPEDKLSRQIDALHSLRLIKLPVSFGTLFFKPDDIVYLEADSNYTNIQLANGKMEMSSYNLGKLEDLLPDKQFIRISRSALINVQYLTRFHKSSKTCLLKCQNRDYELKVSRRNCALLKDILEV